MKTEFRKWTFLGGHFQKFQIAANQRNSEELRRPSWACTVARQRFTEFAGNKRLVSIQELSIGILAVGRYRITK